MAAYADAGGWGVGVGGKQQLFAGDSHDCVCSHCPGAVLWAEPKPCSGILDTLSFIVLWNKVMHCVVVVLLSGTCVLATQVMPPYALDMMQSCLLLFVWQISLQQQRPLPTL